MAAQTNLPGGWSSASLDRADSAFDFESAQSGSGLLALNAAYLCVSQWYVVRTKRRIRRASLQKDPTYVARMARVQFALLAGTFALEDLPSLVVFTYVEARVGGFDGIAQLQLGSSLAGCAFFLYLAYRRRVRGQRARSEAQRATVRQDRSLWVAVLTAFRTDVRDRDLLASATRGAAAHAVGEPRRAQHAKRAFDEGERAVAREMALT